MARRIERRRPQRQENRLAALILGGSIVAFAIVAALIASESFRTAAMTLLVAGAVAGVIIASQRASRRSAQDRRADLERRFDELVGSHVHALAAQRAQKVTIDPYGGMEFEAWEKHFRQEFLPKHVLGFLGPVSPEDAPFVEHLIARLEAIVERIQDAAEVAELEVDVETLDGVGYEHHCARLLTQGGWNATVTKTSGDQGVDIVAERDGFRAVIQCKKYSKPVGNDAVQQVIAGREMYPGARGMVVVSNQPFTRSARALARQCSVLLLSHAQLGVLIPEDFRPK